MKCSKCGRELPGVEFETSAVNKWQCAECSGNPKDAGYCRRGDGVKYAFPNRGTVASQILAGRWLVPGNTYYVDSVKVDDSSTHIKVQGLRFWFNSVHLERVVDA